MKKQWIFLAAVVLMCAFVFVGCDSSVSTLSAAPSTEKTAEPTPTATGTPMPTVTETPAPTKEAEQAEPESTLTVNATETVKKMPDVAYVSIGVRTTGDTAEAAQQENARLTKAFLEAVKAQGVGEKDLETQGVNVYADYENAQKTIAENTYRVTIRSIDKVGAVIDAAIAAGANSTYSLSFDLADRDGVYMEALEKAMKNVESKAKAVAQAGGYALVRPQSIVEGSAGYSAQPYMAGSLADTGSIKTETPVTPQEIEISATVTGTYVIK